MGTEELEVSLKVLQDTVGDLSKRQLRAEETNAFLEQRVRELERRLAGASPAVARSATGEDLKPSAQESPKADLKAGGQEKEAQRLEIAAEAAKEQNDEVQGAELDEEEQEVALEGSTWSAATLVGSPCLSWWGSAWLVLCISINVTIQGIFCIIVFANFLDSEFSPEELDGLRAWRLRIAHDNRFVGPEGLSLGSRVCGLDPTLELSTEQKNRVDLIRNYIPSLDPSLSSDPFSKDQLKAVFDGSVMCILAVTCWSLTVGKELGSAFDLLGAVMRLPRASGRGVHVAKAEDGTVEVQAMGWASKGFVFAVSLLRIGISVMLLAMGCLYLCFISSMEDLLLNAVALEFVMMVDELVFEALAPRRARQVVAKAAPLKLQPWRKFKVLDVKGVGLLALLVLMIVVFLTGPLDEHKQNLIKAHGLMCGGFQEFAVTEDQLGMVHWEKLRPFDAGTEYSSFDRPWDRAVQEQIEQVPVPDNSLAPMSYSFSNLRKVKAATLADTTQGIYSLRFIGCHDALDLTLQDPNLHKNLASAWFMFEEQRRVWLNYLTDRSQKLGKPVVAGNTCMDFSHLCATELSMNAICPETCGCNSLVNGNIFSGLSDGCPGVCLNTVSPVVATQTSCEDARVGDPSDPKWSVLADWASVFGSPLNVSVLSAGCAGLINYRIESFFCQAPTTWSVSNSPLRTSFTATDPFALKLLTYLCPITCNCEGRGGWYSASFQPPTAVCPNQCVCPWPYSTQPGKGLQNCTVPPYSNGSVLETVETDARCCFLMQEHSRSIASTLNTGKNDMATIADTMCRVCYDSCMEQLRTLPVVGGGTYGDAYFQISFGEGTPNRSRWRQVHYCST